ncbi:50S ribosomal protein HLP, mitochondrial-like [Hibiscus syriacus]|uniref:50S ribosomal protein HLP, mitochondrial-like n=1 Tax=Hibiscus syriacus TaxID=106335 RepID=UPI001923D204|nr:50S ribosomal protein HLP, mitochondrial-like [Hibiscus syriacus]
MDGLRNNFANLPSTSRETVWQFPVSATKDFYTDENCSQSSGQLGGKKGDVHTTVVGEERGKIGRHHNCICEGAMPNGKVKKGKVLSGVVVRASMQRGRCDGIEVKFDDNAVVLVDKQGQPIGTRVFGPVPHGPRQKKHVQILTFPEHIA